MTFGYGDIIRQARKAKTLTQEQLAAKIGVSQVAVSEWEREVAFPSKVSELREVLGLTVEDLTAPIATSDRVEQAIQREVRLTTAQRKALVEIYRGLIAGSKSDYRDRPPETPAA